MCERAAYYKSIPCTQFPMIQIKAMVSEKAANPPVTISGVVVTELNNYDVLFGRGMPILKQTGNNRFRTLIAKHRDEYRAVNRHTHKNEIARRINLTIRALGGRFMRKIESTKDKMIYKIDDNFQAWVVVDEKTSLQKVKQTLRELPWNAKLAKMGRKEKRSVDSFRAHSTFTPMSHDLEYQKVCLNKLLGQLSAQPTVETANEICWNPEFSMRRRGSNELARIGGLSRPQFNTAPRPSIAIATYGE
jgi:hypothetical protein